MTDHDLPMTCDLFDTRLAEWLEDELPSTERDAMATHAAGCAECGAIVADLGRLRAEAAALPPLEPARDLWAGIAGRISAPVRVFPTPPESLPLIGDKLSTASSVVVKLVPRRSVATRLRGHVASTSPAAWRGLAAAAALLVVTAGVAYRASDRDTVAAPTVASTLPTTQSAPQAAAATDSLITSSSVAAAAETTPTGAPTVGARPVGAAAVRLVEDRGARPELPDAAPSSVESSYAWEISALSRLVRERRADIDPATLAVLERNLAVIDSAIAQSRAALARAPRDRFLEERLDEALDRKVSLLRTTALLPSRT